MSKKQVYVSENGPEVWLPRGHYTLNEARHEAAQHAQQEIGGWGRARYLGKQDVPLHDHEDFWDCQECATTPTWAFETYEGTYRP